MPNTLLGVGSAAQIGLVHAVVVQEARVVHEPMARETPSAFSPIHAQCPGQQKREARAEHLAGTGDVSRQLLADAPSMRRARLSRPARTRVNESSTFKREIGMGFSIIPRLSHRLE